MQKGSDPVRDAPSGPAAGAIGRIARFVGLSGAGWLFDAALFVAMTSALDAPPGIANAISGVIAASAVFMVANKVVFGATSQGLGRKVVVFAFYQGALIFLASLAVALVYRALVAIVAPVAPQISPALFPIAAKCLVTPFTLGANFLFGKLIARSIG